MDMIKRPTALSPAELISLELLQLLGRVKSQGSVAFSTYAAEFSALYKATEKAMSLRYMLRCLGCHIPYYGS